MCGICGIFGREDKTLVERMLSLLRHRGTDGHGIYSDSNITLGHTRLSIIDLSERGKQPMPNEEGTVWLSVNGEIYNFRQLRDELERNGHVFHSYSDSEVILHLYEEHDLEFIKYLKGMFALSLYDSVKKRLILARDPIGKKPLYYYHDRNITAFASEIKALLAMSIPREIDFGAVWSYLAYQYVLGSSTLFKDIFKLLPGTMVVVEGNSLQTLRYWDIKEHITDIDADVAGKTLRNLLEKSIQYRMIADVPVGAFLSGGIDSSAVVALARPHANEEFHTFSVGFETYSELEYARSVAEHLDTNHHEFTITTDMILQNLKNIAWLYDEPLGDAAIINNYFLSKEAKKYVSVVLAGEGGDEVFAGYPNYQLNLKALALLKKPLVTSIFRNLVQHIPVRYGMYDSSRYATYLRYASFFNETSIERIHLNTTRQMADVEIEELTLLPKVIPNVYASYPSDINVPLNKMLAMDCKNLLPEKFLMKADKGTMAHAVEERAPLLDLDIINFGFSLPPSLKIRNGQEKYILRKAVRGLLPNTIISRPKKGFGTTVGYWMDNDLKEVITQTIDQGKLLKRMLKPDKYHELVIHLDKAVRKSPFKLWTLFALEMWYDIYFTNKSAHV
jgi:asparagine synthase (glutamine-hydrolysing)